MKEQMSPKTDKVSLCETITVGLSNNRVLPHCAYSHSLFHEAIGTLV